MSLDYLVANSYSTEFGIPAKPDWLSNERVDIWGIEIFNLGILTISDAGSKGERADTSGDLISEIMARHDFNEARREIVPDEKELISAKASGVV